MTGAEELRFAFTVDDYDAALRLFHDALGLEILERFDAQGGRGVLLHVPAATLELLDRDHQAIVDDIEVGRPLDYRVRIAVKCADLGSVGEAIQAAGSEPLAEPVDAPWGDRNQRFRFDGGLQLTLFQSLPEQSGR